MRLRRWFPAAKAVGVVLAILVAATQLWDWLTVPDDELVAHVDFGPFLQPPQLEMEFERFGDLRDWEKLAEIVDLDGLLDGESDAYAKDLARKVLFRVSWLLRDRLPASLPYEYRLSGIWLARIVSESPRSLSEVTVTLPDTRYVLIRREGGEASHLESGEVIELGNLRPRESLSIVAWSAYETSARRAEEIKLTHSEGVGSVIVRAPVGRLGQWMDKYWFPAVTLLIYLLIMTIVLVVQLRIGLHIARSDAEDEIDQRETLPGQE